MKNRNASGFTLIELLIVVAIIGIIAAIAIPNLLNALQRGKQKRTMGDLRTVATADEMHAIDTNAFVVQATQGTVASIRASLEPTYVKLVPQRDGWSGDLMRVSDGSAYTLTSFGKDRSAGGGGNVASNGGTTSFSNDIVFADGTFLQFPEGPQT